MEREFIRSCRFWTLALLWLPAGLAATAAVRFAPQPAAPASWLADLPAMTPSLAPIMPCGLPLAFGCRRLWRLGYRRSAWAAGTGLGSATVAGSLFAGLLGPVAIAVCAAILGMAAWIAWWLARRG